MPIVSQALCAQTSNNRAIGGELVLRRILESSGLREGQEFVMQGKGMDLKGDDGEGQNPTILFGSRIESS
jgi:DNA anti-recombination protein RmuC